MLFSIMSGRSVHFVLVGLVCLAIVSCSSSVGSSNNTILCLESEKHALLQFKEGLVDESNALASWESKKDCCEWRGIACNNHTGHVITLNLSSSYLRGEIHPSLLELRNLNYLDLSRNDFGGIMIPKFIGSLSQLKELKLGQANFSGPVPPHLGNLSNLHTLDLCRNYVSCENLEWLSHLSSLRYLNMSVMNLSEAVNWPQSLSKLTSLRELELSSCDLPDVILSSLSFINSSTSLQFLDLSHNNLNSSILHWIANVSTNFVYVDLSENNLEGPIPDAFTSMLSLETLDLSYNQLEGGVPKGFQNLCNLKSLWFGGNQLSGNIEDSMEPLSPLSRLEALSISSNSFTGVITESLFRNLSRLRTLGISGNRFSINLSSDWNPPFQLSGRLVMSSYKLGPAFPKWILTQSNLSGLSLSNCGLAGSLPNEFWDIFSAGLSVLNLSMNHLDGNLPNLSATSLRIVDLSSNLFSGAVPSSFCATRAPYLGMIDISNNLLSGVLPDCWMQFQGLIALNLEKNSLSGNIPSSLGNLTSLELLRLNGNNFSGELPSLENCTELWVVDLGSNNLSGKIPTWIGQIVSNLVILRLHSNKFNGIIPFSLCGLAAIHVLDLSHNNISGGLPHCLNNITALAVDDISFGDIGVELVWKGIEREFGENLGEMRSIDISSNFLVAEIPESITRMEKLKSLNLSGNYLTGKLPENLGNMKMLESLDLSRNQISGEIPASISKLNFLSFLDISHNHLSGSIPLGTQLQSFNDSAYIDNLGLCGPPLTLNCSGNETTDNKEHDTDDGLISLGFFISVVLGFVSGFWIVCGSLLLKSSWRYAYFKLLDDSRDWIYVKTAVYKAKIQRRLQR